MAKRLLAERKPLVDWRDTRRDGQEKSVGHLGRLGHLGPLVKTGAFSTAPIARLD